LPSIQRNTDPILIELSTNYFVTYKINHFIKFAQWSEFVGAL